MHGKKGDAMGKTVAAAMEKRESEWRDGHAKVCKKSMSSSELAAEASFLEMFRVAKSEPTKVVALIPEMYSCMMNMAMSPMLFDSFCENFPFDVVLNAAVTNPDDELRSLALQCIGQASDSKTFPVEIFANPDVLGFLLASTASDDSAMTKAVFDTVGNIVKRSEDARNWVLAAGIMARLFDLPLSFNAASLVSSICEVSVPPDQFLPPIVEYLRRILDGAEIGIMELGLSAVYSLLDNGAHVDPTSLLEFLPHMLLSNDPSIVPGALKILLFVPEIPGEIAQILLQILETEDKSNVVSVLAQVISKFSEPFRPWSQQIFSLLISKVGKGIFKYPVEVRCLLAAFQFCDGSVSLPFFKLLLRYVGAREITCQCITHMLSMISRTPGDQRAEMLQLLSDSSTVFEDLLTDADEQIVAAAEQCLACLDEL